MNPSTTRFFTFQNLLLSRIIYNSRASVSFLPNDFVERSSLHEEIPQNESKYIHEMVGRKRQTRIVYGSGMCSTGALAIEKLLTPPVIKQSLWQPMRILRMNTKKIKFIAAGCEFSLFASNNDTHLRIYGSQRFCSTDENKSSGLFQKFKYYFKRYWYIAIPVHCCLSILFFIFFYTAIYFGLDIVIVLEFLHLPEKWIENVRELPKSASTTAAALILYKIFTPIRYFTTIITMYGILKLIGRR